METLSDEEKERASVLVNTIKSVNRNLGRRAMKELEQLLLDRKDG
jgi:flagellar motor switch protein FliG